MSLPSNSMAWRPGVARATRSTWLAMFTSVPPLLEPQLQVLADQDRGRVGYFTFDFFVQHQVLGEPDQFGMAFFFCNCHQFLEGSDDGALHRQQIGHFVVQFRRHDDRGRHLRLYRSLSQGRQQAQGREHKFIFQGEVPLQQPGHQARGFAGAVLEFPGCGNYCIQRFMLGLQGGRRLEFHVRVFLGEAFLHTLLLPYCRRKSHSARVTSAVRAAPPRSGVKTFFAVTASIARISRAADRASPRCSSIIAAVQNVAMGLAMPLPVMSKAEPWIGSNIDGNLRSGFRFAVGAMPSDPDSAAARSERMSACRFDATMVSSEPGFSTMRVVTASTSSRSHFTSGNSFASPKKITSHSTMPWRWAFDFVTRVRCLRGRLRASANAKRCTRSTPWRVNTEVSVATSSGNPRCTRPPEPEYSPSVFSRTITQSISRPFASGLVMPGSTRDGRTLAYWSKPWQIGRG